MNPIAKNVLLTIMLTVVVCGAYMMGIRNGTDTAAKLYFIPSEEETVSRAIIYQTILSYLDKDDVLSCHSFVSLHLVGEILSLNNITEYGSDEIQRQRATNLLVKIANHRINYPKHYEDPAKGKFGNKKMGIEVNQILNKYKENS